MSKYILTPRSLQVEAGVEAGVVEGWNQSAEVCIQAADTDR